MTPQPSVLSLIITLGAALLTGGAGAALINGMLARRKNTAESEKTNVDTALSLVREMRKDMTDLRHDVEMLEDWKRAAEDIFGQLRRKGVDLDLSSLPRPNNTGPNVPRQRNNND
jgi:hypothetical protein